jgi:hypothetical protein
MPLLRSETGWPVLARLCPTGRYLESMWVSGVQVFLNEAKDVGAHTLACPRPRSQ